MTDQDELRDRIVEAFKRGADGYGGVEGGAQAIIEEFGLTVETVEGVMDPNGDYDAARVVGKWEKQ